MGAALLSVSLSDEPFAGRVQDGAVIGRSRRYFLKVEIIKEQPAENRLFYKRICSYLRNFYPVLEAATSLVVASG